MKDLMLKHFRTISLLIIKMIIDRKIKCQKYILDNAGVPIRNAKLWK